MFAARDTDVCLVDGCEEPPRSRGHCQTHYVAKRRSGAWSDAPYPVAHGPCAMVYCGEVATNGPACARCYRQLRRYPGFTPQRFNEMMLAQESACGICGTDIGGQRAGRNHRYHIDHDHDTGKIRGLLCPHCNKGLGHFGDDPDTIQSAVDYLEDHREHG